jgi:hypothetical protein
MSPGARLLLDLQRGCCVWPHGDPALDSFRWCGAAALPGKSYCSKHQRLAYEHDGEDIAALDDVVDDGNRTYRVERQAGRSLGDRRLWHVVPVAGSAPARRSPDSASTAATSSRAASDEDSHPRAALRLPTPRIGGFLTLEDPRTTGMGISATETEEN